MSDSRRQRDKSLSEYHGKAATGKRIIAHKLGNDFTDGHRGMARAVKGAKKYVRSRTRFHNKMELRNLHLGEDL